MVAKSQSKIHRLFLKSVFRNVWIFSPHFGSEVLNNAAFSNMCSNLVINIKN